MTDLGGLDWRLLGPDTRDGATNMALDAAAAETAGAGGPATARVYGWDPSTLSLGYAQDPATVDWAYCERAGVEVTRRPTGGGAIYHDARGDVAYSVVVPAEAVPGDLLAAYELLCAPVLDAFARLGVDAGFAAEESPAVHEPACYLRALHPAHDVVGPDGRKLSGNAQYRRKDAVVQHGSLSVSLAPGRHCAPFAADLSESRFAERVGAVDEYVDASRADVVEALCASLAEWSGAEPAAFEASGTSAAGRGDSDGTSAAGRG
ncbi:MAG: biotin/lipoate A/B protein ligase family protein, partial [Haloarculaceae archaeon]